MAIPLAFAIIGGGLGGFVLGKGVDAVGDALKYTTILGGGYLIAKKTGIL